MKESINGHSSGVEVEEQIRLSSHKWHISCLAFSTNGIYFASGSWDKQVKVWDLRVLTSSFQLGNQSNGHEAPVTTVSWFPNVEFLLASGSADNSVRIWNSESGERLSVLQEHTGWILGSSFNSSGSLLATASWDKTIGIWDINSLKLSQMLHGHTAGIWGCEFRSLHQDDNIICSASEDSSMKIWDLRADSSWHSVSNLVGAHDDAIRCCAWSPCGNYIAAGSCDTKISVWDIRENRALSILSGHSDMVTGIKFLPFETNRGFQILASVGGTTCRFWCPFASKKSKQLQSLKQHDLDYEVECLDLSPDGTLLATGGRDNKIALSTVNINEIDFDKWNIEEPNTKFTKQQQKSDIQGSKLTRKVSAQSSALMVDSAVQQNEMIENEKAKKIAKQTVKMKSSATSDVLQHKLMELKFNKSAPPHDGQNHGAASSSLGQEVKRENGQDIHRQKHGNPSLISIPEPDYSFGEEEIPANASQSTHVNRDNPDAVYENGLILNSIRNPERVSSLNDNQNKLRLISTASTCDSLNTEIEDVANELIRISEEQQSYDEKL